MTSPASPHGGADDLDRYPRQRARTRGFRLGQPRAFAIAPDGSRIAFLRERTGTDLIGCLWVTDLPSPEPRKTPGRLTERLVVDPRLMASDIDADDLPDAERSRRERLREGGAGIAAFATDGAVRRAAFALGGRAFIVALDDPAATPDEVPGSDGAVDPRLSPDGRHLGFIAAGTMMVSTLGPGGRPAEPVALAVPETPTVTWGLADFIAAEEFSRVRGWWWLADSSALLIERVDTAPVETWWIGDPAEPDQPPRAQRYPAAGRANADVSLWLVDLTGRRREIAWDRERFPYLTSVHIGSVSIGPEDATGLTAVTDPIVAVLSRHQRDQRILRLDPDTATSTVIAERHDDDWIDVVPGVPRLDAQGNLLEIARDRDSDTNRLIIDGTPVSPPGFQVRGVGDVDADGLVVHGSQEPAEEIPVLVTGTAWHPLAASGIGAARRVGDVLLLSTTTPADSDAAPGTTVTVRFRTRSTTGSRWSDLDTIESVAEIPLTAPTVVLTRLAPDRLPAAILWPTGHVPGSHRLPILLAPYGGPHARRVLDSRLAYATDQWWADQGFCVVIADGRGTPGRGPAWERAIRGDLAACVLDDQIAALDAILAAHPHDTDPTRVGIHGWSFGGFLAALAVLRRPDRVHAAVAGAPVTDWRLYDTAYTERYLGDPAHEDAAYEANSLIADAPHLIRPLLLIHGLADDNVVAAHTLSLSSALLAAGRPHSVLPLSGVTHMTPQETIAENLLLAQADFLLTHLASA